MPPATSLLRGLRQLSLPQYLRCQHQGGAFRRGPLTPGRITHPNEQVVGHAASEHGRPGIAYRQCLARGAQQLELIRIHGDWCFVHTGGGEWGRITNGCDTGLQGVERRCKFARDVIDALNPIPGLRGLAQPAMHEANDRCRPIQFKCRHHYIFQQTNYRGNSCDA